MRKILSPLFLVFGACIVPSMVAASTPAQDAAVEAPAVVDEPMPTGPVAPFIRGHQELRKRVETGRGFRGIDDEAKARLYAAQDRVIAHIQPHARFEDMGEADAAAFLGLARELTVAQQAVVGQELVCRRMRPLGSQITENVCRTRDDIAARGDATTDAMYKHLQLQTSEYCQAGVCIK